jgi:uncharacterized protein YuzE
MDKVRIYYDAFGKTLTIWFTDPEREEVSEEAEDDVVLMKDAAGQVIGLEKLNVTLPDSQLGLTVEIVHLPIPAA